MRVGQNFAAVNGPITFLETWNTESDFNEVRLIYADVSDHVSRATVAALAPTSALNDLHQPVDEQGAKTGFKDVTFLHQDISLQERCGKINLLPGDGRPDPLKISLSDFIPVQSLKRTDGGPGHLLSIRTFVDKEKGLASLCTLYDNKVDAADTSAITGRVHRKAKMAGDLVTGSPDAKLDGSKTTAVGYGKVYAIQTVSSVLGATVQAVGDSILQGIGFEGPEDLRGRISFAHIACARASRPSCPVTLLQGAVGGQQSVEFFHAAQIDLAYSDIAVALIQTWSGNDVFKYESTPAERGLAADAAWGRAMHYAELVRKQGGIPIFLSAVPQAPLMRSFNDEIARMSSVERCSLLADRGEYVLDLNGLFGDGSRITNYKKEYRWMDNIHPNTAAHYAAADALLPILKEILGDVDGSTGTC